MKRYLLLAACLWPGLAYGQQTYTNADLVKLEVPGAYTNEDLRRLPPSPVQRAPIAAPSAVALPQAPSADYQVICDNMRRARAALVDERDYEVGRVERSESALAGDSRSFEPRLGYRTRVAPFIQELEKRIALLDRQIDRLLDEARRAGASIDQR